MKQQSDNPFKWVAHQLAIALIGTLYFVSKDTMGEAYAREKAEKALAAYHKLLDSGCEQ